MLLPFNSIWPRTPVNDPSARIDRYLADRAERLAAGIHVDRGFVAVSGAMIISRGRGKFLRIKHVCGTEIALPKSLCREFKEFVNSETASIADYMQLKTDLAGLQIQVIDQLKQQAGKYVDRLLTVSVRDPGIWTTGFDGRNSYNGFCDAALLAEQSGITIIDSFPSRDVSAGGNGGPLDAIALWLLLADRDRRIATTHKAVVSFNSSALLFHLPASDGLDDELPAIGYSPLPDVNFITRFIQASTGKPIDEREMARRYADGRCNEQLVTAFANANKSENAESTSCGVYETAIAYVSDDVRRLSDTVTSAFTWLARTASSRLNEIRTGTNSSPTDVFVTADPVVEACLINSLNRELPVSNVKSMRQHTIGGDRLPAVVTAIMGLMHIDQLPGNVPWITGADSQRILGRLTPGNAANWRQLLLDMADFQPPAMKLRDAM